MLTQFERNRVNSKIHLVRADVEVIELVRTPDVEDTHMKVQNLKGIVVGVDHRHLRVD